MKRQAKTLQQKAKNNQVQPVASGKFWVTSATSGKRYLVSELSNGGFQCVCKWSEYHDTSKNPCSHTMAVREWLEVASNRKLSFWSAPEEAQRQHRPIERIGVGLWTTSRKTT